MDLKATMRPKLVVLVPTEAIDRLTGKPLDDGQVHQAMKVEMGQLPSFGVGDAVPEKEGRKLTKQQNVKVMSSRWVVSQKTVSLARARVVVRDFSTGKNTAIKYMPQRRPWMA